MSSTHKNTHTLSLTHTHTHTKRERERERDYSQVIGLRERLLSRWCIECCVKPPVSILITNTRALSSEPQSPHPHASRHFHSPATFHPTGNPRRTQLAQIRITIHPPSFQRRLFPKASALRTCTWAMYETRRFWCFHTSPMLPAQTSRTLQDSHRHVPHHSRAHRTPPPLPFLLTSLQLSCPPTERELGVGGVQRTGARGRKG